MQCLAAHNITLHHITKPDEYEIGQSRSLHHLTLLQRTMPNYEYKWWAEAHPTLYSISHHIKLHHPT